MAFAQAIIIMSILIIYCCFVEAIYPPLEMYYFLLLKNGKMMLTFLSRANFHNILNLKNYEHFVIIDL